MDNNLDWWYQRSPLQRLTTRLPSRSLTTGHCWKRSSDFFPLPFAVSSPYALPVRLAFLWASCLLCGFLPSSASSSLTSSSLSVTLTELHSGPASALRCVEKSRTPLWLAINIDGDVWGEKRNWRLGTVDDLRLWNGSQPWRSNYRSFFLKPERVSSITRVRGSWSPDEFIYPQRYCY